MRCTKLMMIAAALALAGAAADGTLIVAEPPSGPAPSESPARSGEERAGIEALGFLAGSWRGEMNGSFVEENWSRPEGNNIIGTFRWLKKDGTPAMFEMLTITREADVTRLRLRHYSPTLAAKEERDQPMTLRLAEVSGKRAVFEAERDAGDLARIVYEVKGEELAISVQFVKEERGSLEFKLKGRD